MTVIDFTPEFVQKHLFQRFYYTDNRKTITEVTLVGYSHLKGEFCFVAHESHDLEQDITHELFPGSHLEFVNKNFCDTHASKALA